MEGISVRSLYINVISSLVIFLYLFDNETSWMIFLSQVSGIVLEVWKIRQASDVIRTDTFPYFKL